MYTGIPNLLQETVEVLGRHGKTYDDVCFVLCKGCAFTPEAARPMLDFCYDQGYGGVEVEESLKIVGKDFWLERHEYDGSEWYEFKQLPQLPENNKDYPFSTFRTHYDYAPPEEYDDYTGRK